MRLNLIQALRAFAAYLVVFYHIRAIEFEYAREMGTDEYALVGGLFSNGWAGVDLFFVISGFIMVYVTFSRPSGVATVKDFLLARAFRIYPPWWLFSGMMALFFFLSYGTPYDAAALAQYDNDPLNHILRSIFLLPQPNFPILGLGWTLVHEVWFYIVFAFILLAPRKYMPTLLGLWAIIVLGGAAMGWSAAYAADYLKLAFSVHTVEFIVGAFTAYLFLKQDKPFFPAAIFGLGVVAFIAATLLHPYPNRFTLEWGRMLVFTLPCAMLLYGAAGLQARATSEWLKPLSRLGDWSFSLYLGHHFVIAGLPIIGAIIAAKAETMLGMAPGTLNMFRLGSEGIFDNALFMTGMVIGSTLFAAIIYHFFEQPALRFLTKRFRKPQTDKEKARLNETVAP
ncbi:acyltransferase family protein [Ponticaulis koreensis]|uniref:acyltransferase family protein n=1 Tax=Ponticaulis koreensis TaxID=1123045 RepID=UPI0003B633C0|nr:acyltransferase [Ponticaulis koreensis]